MSRDDYFDGLRSAYLGELAGAAFARALAVRLTEPSQSEDCRLIELIETATARIIAPLLPLLPDDDALLDAERRGDAAGHAADWPDLIEYTANGLGPYVATFARLRDAASVNDRQALELLVTHEIALEAFGQATLNGHSTPAEPLRTALAAAECYLAGRP